MGKKESVDEVMIALERWHLAITEPIGTDDYIAKATARLRAALLAFVCPESAKRERCAYEPTPGDRVRK